METDLLSVAFLLLLTWWVHSTLLLGIALVISLCRRTMPARTREWLCKSAVVLPCLTVPVQYGLKTSLLWQWELPSMATQAAPNEEPVSDPRADAFPPSSRIPESTQPSPTILRGLPESSPHPAIAEKPGPPPILIETVVAEPSSFQIQVPLNSLVPIEEHAAENPLAMQATHEIPNDTDSFPQRSLSPTNEEAQSQPGGWPWFVPVFVGTVLVTAFLGGLRFLWVWISTSRLIARSLKLTTGKVHAELKRLLTQSRMRRPVQLAESAECSVPAAGGLFRQVILLPLNIENRLSREELRALLAHELGHHARGDVWWLWLGRGLCHLLPVQPLYFWAVREWHRAAEPLCDDWAIERNISPVALAKSLTQVAGWCIAKPAIGPAATNGPSLLTHRVERLLNRTGVADSLWKSRFIPMLTPLLALVALAFAPLVSWPQAGTPLRLPPASSWESPSPSEPLKAPPMESEPTALPLAAENPHPIPEDIRADLEAIQNEMDLALTLLQMADDDPEIRSAVEQLQQRLQALQIEQTQLTDAARRHSP